MLPITFSAFCVKLHALCLLLSLDLVYTGEVLEKIKKLYTKLFDYYKVCKEDHSVVTGRSTCIPCYINLLLCLYEFFNGVVQIREEHTKHFVNFFVEIYRMWSRCLFCNYPNNS